MCQWSVTGFIMQQIEPQAGVRRIQKKNLVPSLNLDVVFSSFSLLNTERDKTLVIGEKDVSTIRQDVHPGTERNVQRQFEALT